MATEKDDQPRLAKAIAWMTLAGGVIAVLAFFGIRNWHDLQSKFADKPAQAVSGAAQPLPVPSQVLPSEIHDELGDVYLEAPPVAPAWVGPGGYDGYGYAPCVSTDQCLGLVSSMDLYHASGQGKVLDVRIYAFPNSSVAASNYAQFGTVTFPVSSCVATSAKVSGRFIVAARAQHCTGQDAAQAQVAALAAVDQIGQAFASL